MLTTVRSCTTTLFVVLREEHHNSLGIWSICGWQQRACRNVVWHEPRLANSNEDLSDMCQLWQSRDSDVRMLQQGHARQSGSTHSSTSVVKRMERSRACHLVSWYAERFTTVQLSQTTSITTVNTTATSEMNQRMFSWLWDDGQVHTILASSALCRGPSFQRTVMCSTTLQTC